MKIVYFIVILAFVTTMGINTSAFGQIGQPLIMGLSSPLKQFKSGVKAQDVQCQPYYFTLVIKSEDGTPACVKPDTLKILVERGWAKALQ